MTARPILARVIAERTMSVKDFSKLTKAVASYLLEENRAEELDSLMRDVMKYRTQHGYIEATAVSAHQLTAELRKDVLSLVKIHFPDAKDYVLNEIIDTDVVGGIRIEFAGEELDLSVKAKLNTFKRLTAARKD